MSSDVIVVVISKLFWITVQSDVLKELESFMHKSQSPGSTGQVSAIKPAEITLNSQPAL